MTYFGYIVIQTLIGILTRVSGVFELEEFKINRDLNVKDDQVTVEFKDCTIAWGEEKKEEEEKKAGGEEAEA